MIELELAIENFPFWKAILFCYYPISMVILIELLSNYLRDDDDHDGGKMIPAFQNAKSY